MASLEQRVASLEQRVETLEAGKPGRKRKPILVSREGVCGVEPERNSEDCPFASLYRARHGCKGDACARRSAEYYAEYRSKKK